MSPAPIRKAVFPVAGLGTRFLPATKAIPKEMLTVVDKPAIQYVVEEAKEAGIEHFIFVTGRGKGAIEDHFDIHFELDATLKQRNKTEALEELTRDLPTAGATSFTRQQSPLGLGHAVWCAREIVGREPFAVLLPDMISYGKRGCLAEAMDVYNKTGGNVIAVEECDPALTSQYGIVGIEKELGAGAFQISKMVEKPKPAEAPSNLYINGRYIFQPELFDHLARFEKGAGGEIQVTDAMQALSKEQPFYGSRYSGRTYDTGSKSGFLAANVAFGLARKDLAGDLTAEIKRLLG